MQFLSISVFFFALKIRYLRPMCIEAYSVLQRGGRALCGLLHPH